MRNVITVAVICTLLFPYTVMAQSANKPLHNIGKGLNNIVYGSVETPDNINATKSKVKNFTDCTEKTKDGVGRTIVRVVGGLYQLATFWYPKD